MKIGIIGAGFTGLSAAYYLSKKGFNVTVYESSDKPGGLAKGFIDNNWGWGLEEHYHHFFKSDKNILGFAKEVDQKVFFKAPISSTYIDGNIYQLDSPISLLKFNKLSVFDRLRTGIVIAFLKVNPFWKPLEKISSYDFLIKTMGINSWNIIWRPLFEKKFGDYAKEINAAWFWARIRKRSARLGYPEGGFISFIKKIEQRIVRQGGKIIYNTPVSSIEQKGNKIIIKAGNKKGEFDKVICTLPLGTYLNITKGLPNEYINRISKLKGLGAINLVLSLNTEFFKSGTYWLNNNEYSFPFIALVEHTNFIEKKHYDNNHILYVANYLPSNHRYFSYSEKDLFEEFYPYLSKINKYFSKGKVNKMWIFKDVFAQPVVFRNYSEKIPSFETPIDNLYIANMQQIYPWDRGTNYAVQIGKKVVELVIKS